MDSLSRRQTLLTQVSVSVRAKALSTLRSSFDTLTPGKKGPRVQPTLTIKPTDPAIKQYYDTLKTYGEHNVS
jgi:hypothetical protein